MAAKAKILWTGGRDDTPAAMYQLSIMLDSHGVWLVGRSPGGMAAKRLTSNGSALIVDRVFNSIATAMGLDENGELK